MFSSLSAVRRYKQHLSDTHTPYVECAINSHSVYYILCVDGPSHTCVRGKKGHIYTFDSQTEVLHVCLSTSREPVVSRVHFATQWLTLYLFSAVCVCVFCQYKTFCSCFDRTDKWVDFGVHFSHPNEWKSTEKQKRGRSRVVHSFQGEGEDVLEFRKGRRDFGTNRIIEHLKQKRRT